MVLGFLDGLGARKWPNLSIFFSIPTISRDPTLLFIVDSSIEVLVLSCSKSSFLALSDASILVSMSLNLLPVLFVLSFMARIDVLLDLDIKKFMNRMENIHW